MVLRLRDSVVFFAIFNWETQEKLSIFTFFFTTFNIQALRDLRTELRFKQKT